MTSKIARQAAWFVTALWLSTAGFAPAFGQQPPAGGSNTGTPGIPLGVTTTATTAAPTAGAFSSILAASSTRKGCLVQNTGATLGYVYFGANGGATTANALQVSANGGSISCNNPNGTVLQDNVSATCVSGTCTFVIEAQ
jgi:hypothetical protein